MPKKAISIAATFRRFGIRRVNLSGIESPNPDAANFARRPIGNPKRPSVDAIDQPFRLACRCSLDLAPGNSVADDELRACESQSESRWHVVSLVETVPESRDSRRQCNHENSEGR